MKHGFIVLALALVLAGCGGGGGSPGTVGNGSSSGSIGAGGTGTTSQMVLDIALHSSTSGADLAAVPAGTSADFLVVGSTTTANGSTTVALSGISGNCGTAILCQRTDGFASVATVALRTTAAVTLNSGAPIKVTVDPSVVAGSTLTLTVTETTGRQVTRTFLTS